MSNDELSIYEPPEKKVRSNQIASNISTKVEIKHEPEWCEQDTANTTVTQLLDYRHATSPTTCDTSPSTIKAVSFISFLFKKSSDQKVLKYYLCC